MLETLKKKAILLPQLFIRLIEKSRIDVPKFMTPIVFSSHINALHSFAGHLVTLFKQTSPPTDNVFQAFR